MSAGISKVAVTVVFERTVTVHVPVVLVHAPVHPEKTDPALGVAVRVTDVPLMTVAAQVVPQLIGPPVMVPVPDPPL